jgi:N-acetylglucosaminyl-diphospho-decaprenol L-rhamnosyltransferase
MTVTVALVSWNTRELLVRCLQSLAPEVDAGRARVWVVDNASEDGSAGAAKEHAPWAHVLEPGVNLGFGRAVNLVARQDAGEWLMAANADIALQPGALTALLASGANPNVGCVVPRLLLPSGETQHSVYPLPTVPFTLAFNLGAHRLSRRWASRMCLEGFWDPERPRAVPWAIGACLLIRRAAFDGVGGFDERQWMYAEDLDLGWRLHEQGWVTNYEPSARALHASGAATSKVFGERRMLAFTAATYAVLARRRGHLRAFATAALNVAGAAARLAWMTVLARVQPRWRLPTESNRRWLAAHLHGVRVGLLDARRPQNPTSSR